MTEDEIWAAMKPRIEALLDERASACAQADADGMINIVRFSKVTNATH